ncbi:Alkaline ceramidase 3 [Geodia barretti]|nr:Alkaline ceramidase 3 [Geodia barretti]
MPPYIAPEQNAVVGYWGRPTSTLDWCEENHAWSPYVAEFWNTLSNMAMVLPGLIGMWSCATNGLELRYLLSYFGLFVVGVGSTLFHGTLLYSMQLLDELPMLVCTSLLLFALYEMGNRGNWRTSSYVTAAFLIAYPTITSMVYIFINDPTFHEVAYSIMVFLATVQGYYCVRKYSTWKHSATFATISMGL